MKLYIEFNGNKLRGTECFSYQEARFMLIKILDQCMESYKKYYNKRIFGSEELQMQYKILSKLKMIRQK